MPLADIPPGRISLRWVEGVHAELVVQILYAVHKHKDKFEKISEVHSLCKC